jgi:diguanylate cyclase (GGDEF)-like protein
VRLLDDSAHDLAQLNEAVTQQVEGMFRSADTYLKTLDRWLQANPRIDPRTDPSFVGLVDDLRRASGGLIDLRMASTDGRLFFIPTLDGKALADAGNRPYFTVNAGEGARRLYIGDPILSRVTGKWILPIFWRMESPVAGIGVLFAAIELNNLFVLHERFRLKPNGTITLVRSDGTILSRTPDDRSLIGRSLADSPGYLDEYGVKDRGSFISDRSPTDGVARLVSYRRVPGYPVSVLVTQSVNDVLSIYRTRRAIVIAFAAALTLIIIGFTLALNRSMKALQAMRAELERLASVDGLTGVLNRRAFQEEGEREFARARRYDRPCAVLMLDIDHFKAVNDVHGHAAGDRVLRECAGAWKAALRSQDLLGRTGGEEFCVLLPETPREKAREAAERLREATAALSFVESDRAFRLTVSIGATAIARVDEHLSAAIERADRALYLAKEKGRDRVEIMSAGSLSLLKPREDSA